MHAVFKSHVHHKMRVYSLMFDSGLTAVIVATTYEGVSSETSKTELGTF